MATKRPSLSDHFTQHRTIELEEPDEIIGGGGGGPSGEKRVLPVRPPCEPIADTSLQNLADIVVAGANATFGPENAELWLDRPSAALDGKTPNSLLQTEAGARAVQALLDRLNHGFAA